jgi:hypothetical protein
MLSPDTPEAALSQYQMMDEPQAGSIPTDLPKLAANGSLITESKSTFIPLSVAKSIS